MKALTLKHPFPFAIAYLGKDVENRDWDDRLVELFGLPELVGQQIAIHGGAAPKRGKNKAWRELLGGIIGCHEMLGGELPEQAAQYLAQHVPEGGHIPAEQFIIPGVVAVATVLGYTRLGGRRWDIEGQLHIELSDVITLREPVACPGAQGFWNLPPVIEQAVLAQVQQPVPAQWSHLSAEEWLG